MKRRLLITILVLSFIALPVMAACTKPAPKPEPVILSAVTFTPPEISKTDDFKIFMSVVEELSGGELVIDLIGGPEVFPTNNQGEAAQKGAVDMFWTYYAAYISLVPGLPFVDLISELTFEEEREVGYWDLAREYHAKGGLYFLGKVVEPAPLGRYYTIANKRMASPTDFDGAKIAIEWVFIDFFESLGASTVGIPDEERYTALERGVVDGIFVSIDEVVPFGYHEVAKYLIDGAFGTGDINVTLNLDKWNSLSERHQNILTQAIIDTEPLTHENYKKTLETHGKLLADAGVEWVKFSPEDQGWWRERFLDAEWTNIIENNPEIGPKLKEMLTR